MENKCQSPGPIRPLISFHLVKSLCRPHNLNLIYPANTGCTKQHETRMKMKIRQTKTEKWENAIR